MSDSVGVVGSRDRLEQLTLPCVQDAGKVQCSVIFFLLHLCPCGVLLLLIFTRCCAHLLFCFLFALPFSDLGHETAESVCVCVFEKFEILHSILLFELFGVLHLLLCIIHFLFLFHH